MSKRHIALSVTFEAQSIGDPQIPTETAVTETMSLVIPSMDPKYVVFPKMVEGAIDTAIKNHHERVSEYFRKKAEAERKQRELAQLRMWEDDDQAKESDDANDTEIECSVEQPEMHYSC